MLEQRLRLMESQPIKNVTEKYFRKMKDIKPDEIKFVFPDSHAKIILKIRMTGKERQVYLVSMPGQTRAGTALPVHSAW
jgi:hypothetical protein